MQELDIKYYFGFWNGYTDEDIAAGTKIPDHLYDKLKSIYQGSGETNLQSLLESGQLSEHQEEALSRIIKQLRKTAISLRFNEDDLFDRDTEEYDRSEAVTKMEIIVPDEWDEKI